MKILLKQISDTAMQLVNNDFNITIDRISLNTVKNGVTLSLNLIEDKSLKA